MPQSTTRSTTAVTATAPTTATSRTITRRRNLPKVTSFHVRELQVCTRRFQMADSLKSDPSQSSAPCQRRLRQYLYWEECSLRIFSRFSPKNLTGISTDLASTEEHVLFIHFFLRMNFNSTHLRTRKTIVIFGRPFV